jgi:hypothetical protein
MSSTQPSNLKLLATGRILFGLLGLSAIITEVIVLQSRHTFNPANFFSYFTIQSNCLAVLWLLWFGLASYAKKPVAARWQLIRGGITLYMAMTGIIFAILLAPIENAVLTAVPWDNIVLHYLMPIILLADWLQFPPKTRISFRQSFSWLIFPALYVTYSLIRGHIVGWYPYPFLNASTRGYFFVGLMIAALLVGVVVASQALRWVSARGERLHTRVQ